MATYTIDRLVDANGNEFVFSDSSKAQAGTASPLMDGKASVGNSLKYAREDHVHPSDTSREDIANKTTVVLGTSDRKYPTDKAVAEFVKEGLDAKADASKVLAVADATYTRDNETGPGWNKLASIENFGTWRNNIGAFDLYFAHLGSFTSKATLLVNVRWDSIRTSAKILDGKIIWESKKGDLNVAIVNRASSSSVITEIWAYLPKGNYSMALSYRSGSTKTNSASAHAATFTDNKDKWSFFSYVATSQEKPTEDLTNYVKVKDADVVVLQRTIDSPKNNNLVAMDANGLVKDSGIRITSSDIANWNSKQNSLTFDTTPTAGSTNPVTSDGIKTAIDNVQTNIDAVNAKGLTVKEISGEQVICFE